LLPFVGKHLNHSLGTKDLSKPFKTQTFESDNLL